MRAELLRQEPAAIAYDQARGVGTTHPRLEAALTDGRADGTVLDTDGVLNVPIRQKESGLSPPLA